MPRTLGAVALIALLIFTSGGCYKVEPAKPRQKRSEAPEYNCLHHAKDNICEVPVNGKVVLYCVKGLKRVVHYRWECK